MPRRRKPAHWLRYRKGPVDRGAGFRSYEALKIVARGDDKEDKAAA